jgi:hypothetical protein
LQRGLVDERRNGERHRDQRRVRRERRGLLDVDADRRGEHAEGRVRDRREAQVTRGERHARYEVDDGLIDGGRGRLDLGAARLHVEAGGRGAARDLVGGEPARRRDRGGELRFDGGLALGRGLGLGRGGRGGGEERERERGGGYTMSDRLHDAVSSRDVPSRTQVSARLRSSIQAAGA